MQAGHDIQDWFLNLAIEANANAKAAFSGEGSAVETTTGLSIGTFSEIPAAGVRLTLKTASSTLVDKLAVERRVTQARIDRRAKEIEILRAKKADLQAALLAKRAGQKSSKGSGDDSAVSVEQWTKDSASHSLVAKYRGDGWHAEGFYQKLLRDARDYNEKEIAAVEARLVELLAKRRVPAGEVSLAAKRRHLDRARREAFEQEEIDRLAEQARKEKAEEHARAVETFRQAEHQRLLELDLHDQLLALEHEELELEAAKERLSSGQRQKHKVPSPNDAATRDLYTTMSSRAGFKNDGNIHSAVLQALGSQKAVGTIANLRTFDDFLSGSRDVSLLGEVSNK
eukprot:m.159645 g.159645  ORF g.159645 m.159645 type:complete len:341 (+) comp14535_c0_seq6:256-1278(+)